jgi:eukaryotic-like serine/threonine-protein kinase
MTHDDQAPAPRGLETQSIDDDAPSSPSVSEGDFPFVDRDHYEIGEEFARGGGGRLRRARDLRLNRVVAIKEPIALSARIEQRFLREAVLTARLQHPSIVPVHEIGRWPTGEPFYAMKLVSGRSLRDVVAETTTIEQRVAFLPNVLAVTDAIAYAHSQGVIHRDLKSSNVMIGAFGETQVIDWGLAKELHAPEDTAEDLAAREAQETNGIRGTPATMAPEQATGKRVDERTDVYGIGALLYQVLAGGAPYEGDTAPDVIARVAAEPPRPLIERAPRAPRELVAIAERAMARDPAQRYPSAADVADDLRRFLNGQLVRAHRYSIWWRVRRFVTQNRRVLVAIAVSLSLGTAAAFSIAQARASRAPPLCPSASPLLGGVWDDGRKAQLAAAFRATKVPYAEDAIRGATQAFDDYAAGWVAMRQEACVATRVRGTQSSELMDLRMKCLEDRLVSMRAMVDQLVSADARTVERARRAADALPPISPCADAAALRATLAPPRDASAHARIDGARARLAHALALEQAGRLPDAVAEAERAAADAKAIGYPPVEAEALDQWGRLQGNSGERGRASATLEDAVLAAVAGRHESVEAKAWCDLVLVEAEDQRNAEAQDAARHAHAVLERSPDDGLLAFLLTAEAEIARNESRLQDGRAMLERALAIEQGTVPASLAKIAQTESELGGVLYEQARYDDALVFEERALADRIKFYGPVHPSIAASTTNVANNLDAKGDHDGAVAMYRRAIELYGSNSEGVASALANMGEALEAAGKLDEALAAERQALALRETFQEPTHRTVLEAQLNIADMLLHMNRWSEALATIDRVLALSEKAKGLNDAWLATPVTSRGEALLRMGKARQALPVLERALTLAPSTDGSPMTRARADHLLALTLKATGGDMTRARKLADEARTIYAQAPLTYGADMKELDTAFPSTGLRAPRTADAPPAPRQ